MQVEISHSSKAPGKMFGSDDLEVETERPVLIVEDDNFDAAITTELLERCSDQTFEVTRAKRLDEALKLLSEKTFSIALVDMGLPDSTGLNSVAQAVKADPNMPIVVLTGNESPDTALMAMRIGAQDYIPKSQLDNRTLQRVIEYSIQRKAIENEMSEKANQDSITGLMSRTLLYDRWQRIVARAERDLKKIGLLMVNVNDFGTVSSRHGAVMADALLIHVSQKLSQIIFKADLVARLQGHEFIVILENLDDVSQVESVRLEIESALSEDFTHDGQTIAFSATVGSTICHPRHDDGLMGAIQRADQDMADKRALSARELNA